MFKLDLENTEEPEIKLPTSVAAAAAAKSLQSCATLCNPIDSSPSGCWGSLLDHQKSKIIPKKHINFCFIDYAKAFGRVDHNKLWKISTDGNTRPPYLLLEKPVYGSRSNS